MLVRACEATYIEEELTTEGIKVESLVFPDGQLPNDEVKKKWLDIVDEFFDGPDSDR